jgi:ribosomal protein L40E
MDPLAIVLILVGVIVFVLLGGVGRSRDDFRRHGRWESSFYAEDHRQVHTDATGMLVCRRCGESASERAGHCPSCGAGL